ncbi:acyl-CoA reductase [Clostridium senegalense]|uniref:BadF/BadG/BcrA/BcrD ATPase family protein n=1 Tax=Clostridium senegalense TaxID=1465809 RepID=UPI001C104074|nr:BadF/BadG/BcrA/BcrD ATPase family protein [Clostridium senegalense]MBU5227341.1 acyl-CoA reductase [Clostridium senegalense]
MYFLGIDGGGSKTKAVLCDEYGKIKYTMYKGSLNYYQIGKDGIKTVLHQLVEEILCNINDIKKDDIVVGLGMPSYKEVVNVTKIIDQIVKEEFHFVKKFIVENDGIISINGSLIGKKGIHIVSGTGSIGISLNEEGVITRVGGWGPEFGDEGSAYWIGKKTLEIFSKQCDGRYEKTLLYYLIKKYFNLNNNFDIIKYFSNDLIDKRKEIAKISKLCFEAATRGDVLCKNVFTKASLELSNIVKALIKNFKGDEEIFLSYSGGVFKSKNLILTPLMNSLCYENITLVKPILPPELGACLMAFKSINNDINKVNNFIDNLILCKQNEHII